MSSQARSSKYMIPFTVKKPNTIRGSSYRSCFKSPRQSRIEDVIDGEKVQLQGSTKAGAPRGRRPTQLLHLQFLAGHTATSDPTRSNKSPELLRPFRPGTPPLHVQANCRT
ncbi:hypothetical protein TNCV_3618411 [Trichonephila clavipes]|nr:hypothetical protein TNCV_3618411 [Trichonephila clavipes]